MYKWQTNIHLGKQNGNNFNWRICYNNKYHINNSSNNNSPLPRGLQPLPRFLFFFFRFSAILNSFCGTSCNVFLSTRCGDILVKQRGNGKAEWNSSQVNYGHPRAEILTIVASYLKSIWFCSRSWTSVRSSRFSPLLDGRTTLSRL